MAYNSHVNIKCRYFSGYKPCNKNSICDENCQARSNPSKRLLIVHLEALGAVLRSTSLLPAIHRKYPGVHITWVTKKPAQQLLAENPLIDQILTLDQEDLLKLSCLEFDIACCIDKAQTAFGVIRQTKVKEVFGFQVHPESGSIICANSESRELWQLGLNDEMKLFHNIKAETQLVHEALALGDFKRDPYTVAFTDSEKEEIYRRRKRWSDHKIVVGINTGCSTTIPYKKLTISTHRTLIKELLKSDQYKIVLLGGKEDTLRNQKIAYGLDVISSPTNRSLRDGLISTATCDMVITGDSLGMHMAIALRKWVVVWFGPTCSQEIDLYDRGVKVLTTADCSPCWKRSCQKRPMCYDKVPLEFLLRGIEKGKKWLQSTCSSKPLLWEISSSPSP